MTLDRFEHVDEPAHDMWPDRLELESARERDDRQLFRRDGEVIGPEMDQSLGKGRWRGKGGGNPRVDGIDILKPQPTARPSLGGTPDGR